MADHFVISTVMNNAEVRISQVENADGQISKTVQLTFPAFGAVSGSLESLCEFSRQTSHGLRRQLSHSYDMLPSLEELSSLASDKIASLPAEIFERPGLLRQAAPMGTLVQKMESGILHRPELLRQAAPTGIPIVQTMESEILQRNFSADLVEQLSVSALASSKMEKSNSIPVFRRLPQPTLGKQASLPSDNVVFFDDFVDTVDDVDSTSLFISDCEPRTFTFPEPELLGPYDWFLTWILFPFSALLNGKYNGQCGALFALVVVFFAFFEQIEIVTVILLWTGLFYFWKSSYYPN